MGVIAGEYIDASAAARRYDDRIGCDGPPDIVERRHRWLASTGRKRGDEAERTRRRRCEVERVCLSAGWDAASRREDGECAALAAHQRRSSEQRGGRARVGDAARGDGKEGQRGSKCR